MKIIIYWIIFVFSSVIMIEIYNGWMVYHPKESVKGMTDSQTKLIPLGIIYINISVFGSCFRFYLRFTGNYTGIIDIKPWINHYIENLSYYQIISIAIALVIGYLVGVHFLFKKLVAKTKFGGEAGISYHLFLVNSSTLYGNFVRKLEHKLVPVVDRILVYKRTNPGIEFISHTIAHIFRYLLPYFIITSTGYDFYTFGPGVFYTLFLFLPYVMLLFLTYKYLAFIANAAWATRDKVLKVKETMDDHKRSLEILFANIIQEEIFSRKNSSKIKADNWWPVIIFLGQLVNIHSLVGAFYLSVAILLLIYIVWKGEIIIFPVNRNKKRQCFDSRTPWAFSTAQLGRTRKIRSLPPRKFEKLSAILDIITNIGK
jgi:hypothetical protein